MVLKKLKDITSHKQLEKFHSSIFGDAGNNFLKEFVYGGIDGIVTTFAVVAGAMGANFSAKISLILGIANLIADGFSMSVGEFLASKSEVQKYLKTKAIETWEMDVFSEDEEKEIQEIYENHGFTGKDLEAITKLTTANKAYSVQLMMQEEHNLQKPDNSPFQGALATFISFVIMGSVPLAPYVWSFFISPLSKNTLFLYSATGTALAFMVIGFLKGYVTHSSKIRGIGQTLFLGAIASMLAYFVGTILEKIIA